MHKDLQPIGVPRNGMVLEITEGHLLQPFADLRGRLVHPATKFRLDRVQPRHHPLLRRFAPDDEGPVAPALPAVVREAQEREGFRLPFPTLLPVSSGVPPNSISLV